VSSRVLEIVARDFDGGFQFLYRELDGASIFVLRRQHRTRGHHLDEVGAAGKLASGCGTDLIGSVRHLVHARIVLDPASGDRQQPSGKEHARSNTPAELDGLAHRHLDIVPAAAIADRRGAAQESPFGGLCRIDGDECVGPGRHH